MALSTTISGITSSQSMMDVIADNIANINTTGFKGSNINFATVFSKTISAGGVATDKNGGTNAKQIGMGVAVSEISRNFTRGSVDPTGISTDLNIQGDGFFTLKNANGQTFLSRAGNFSADSAGNLVNPDGLKVVGTASTTSSVGGLTTVKIPTALVLTETNVVSDGTTAITPGNFTINIAGKGAQSVTIANTDTKQDIVNKINSNLSLNASSNIASLNSSGQIVITGSDTVAFADGTSNFATIAAPNAAYTSAAFSGAPVSGDFTLAVNGGTAITLTISPTDTLQNVVDTINASLSSNASTNVASLNAANKIVITGADTLVFADGTSTFTTDANFTQAGGPYTSKVLHNTPKISIGPADISSANNYKVSSFSIATDGSVDITYSNGGKLTVQGDPARSLKYTTSGSQDVANNDVTVVGGAVDPAQLQIQLANVINPKGLQSAGGNLFTLDSVSGAPNFAIGNSGGLGAINSGGLESSNVDLPTEFANMILAQKSIEANSRAFSIENQILDTIVNLGR